MYFFGDISGLGICCKCKELCLSFCFEQKHGDCTNCINLFHLQSVLFVVVLTTTYHVRTFALYISVYSADQINRVYLTYILKSFFKNGGKIGGRLFHR